MSLLLNQEEIDSCRKLFDNFDTEKSGFIEMKDLLSIFDVLNQV